MDLKRQIELKNKEIAYYKRIATQAGIERLRETEELSKLTSQLYEKITTIKEQQKELEDKNKIIESLSITDPLTKLLNRRGLMDKCQTEFDRRKRLGYKKCQPDAIGLSLAIFDIDFFKRINDNYGHLIGDKTLSALGKIFLNQKKFRKTDIVGRYGGEEFITILTGCSEPNSAIPLNEIKGKISKMRIPLENNEDISITVSIGVSEVYDTDADLNSVLNRADKALYWAKEHGRNQICFHSHINT